MKKVMVGLLCMGVAFSLRAQEPGFHLEGIKSQALPVMGRKMTNIIFPVDIAAGVRVSNDVLVQKVKGVENVIELKALRRDFPSTNLSVYGKDGRLYSFILHYVEDTTILNYKVIADGDRITHPVRLTGWPADQQTLQVSARVLAARHGFLHRRVSSDGVELGLTGVYLRDSLLWLCLRLRDRTGMGYVPELLRIYTEDRKKVKRMATQSLDIPPVYVGGLGAVPDVGSRVVAVGLNPVVVGRVKRLVISVADATGERMVSLRIKGKVLLRGRRG